MVQRKIQQPSRRTFLRKVLDGTEDSSESKNMDIDDRPENDFRKTGLSIGRTFRNISANLFCLYFPFYWVHNSDIQFFKCLNMFKRILSVIFKWQFQVIKTEHNHLIWRKCSLLAGHKMEWLTQARAFGSWWTKAVVSSFSTLFYLIGSTTISYKYLLVPCFPTRLAFLK